MENRSERTVGRARRPFDDELRAEGLVDGVLRALCAAGVEEEGEAVEARSSSPARLTVYDAPLDPESITAQMRDNLDDEITEVKSENAIDRITSQSNPRTLERVPAGARFRVRLVLDVLCEEDKALAARVLEGLRLLEDDALGGGGSRGSGRVRFSNVNLAWRNRSFYSTGAAEAELAAGADLGAVQAAVNDASFAEKLAS